MLNVQIYLQTKTFSDLEKEFGIIVKKHDTLPFAILNYDQIESPKTNPIVKECRALVLHTETKEIISRSFSRFFNWGEVVEDMKEFDFSDFLIQSKEDGSLCNVFYYEGKWHANTRGSFATDNLQFQDFTWQDAFCKAFKINNIQELKLDKQYTYIFEFCSPWNKIVRRYEQPVMYLLTMFKGMHELSWKEVCDLHIPVEHLKPTIYQLNNIDAIQQYLQEQSNIDKTFEGVVIRDKNGLRYKIKSSAYMALHALRGNGDNLFNPKYLVPFILIGEDDELLTYFPEVTEFYLKLKEKVLTEYVVLVNVWEKTKDIAVQKDFALAVKDQTPYTAILFNMRKKYGFKQTLELLNKEWRNSEENIIKKHK